MIQLDITKALHPRTFGYFAPLMPGLFFEISILLFGPHSFRDLAGHAQLGYYTSLVVALILAFIIGTGFMLLVRLIQRTMGLCYRIVAIVWQQIARSLLNPLGRILSSPKLHARVRPWLNRLHRSLIQDSIFSSDLGHVERAWGDAAVQLLKERYGIEEQSITMEAVAWYNVLGTPPPHMRGSLIAVASEATGWCGVVAAYIVPALKNRYYLGFSLFLLVYGLLQDWWVARNWNNCNNPANPPSDNSPAVSSRQNTPTVTSCSK